MAPLPLPLAVTLLLAIPAGVTAAARPPPPPPPPPPIACFDADEPCLPAWKPTWHMKNSTVLYACNVSGMHSVQHANQFGIVVYDWSNARAIWTNSHPMSAEELLLKQAEMVLAANPGVPGYAPRVWVYRNTIKALNWFSSVRVKLDDPRYASWFVKFKGFSDNPYPGGAIAQPQNASYHVPACDWYNNGTAPRCSGFYHDQQQTPEHPNLEPGNPYPMDGHCFEQCDCGFVNPCGEYIFNHSGAEVEGRTFRDWFINEYMITNETLYHKNPKTGEKQVIGLGYLDDSMQLTGPTEEDSHYIADTGASTASMIAQTAAFKESMDLLLRKVRSLGGFWWQLMDGSGVKLNPTGSWSSGANISVTPKECKAVLEKLCVGANASATPSVWNRMQMYTIPNGGKNVTTEGFLDYTAEFLLTRGPYAVLGYGWCGCTGGDEMRPRAKEWDIDFGEPLNVCKETSEGSGVYERKWSRATVQWDCASGHGKIAASDVPGSPVPVDVFLATNGSDDNDGSSAATAVATVPAAQHAVRKALSASGQKSVTVWIGAGNYVLSRALNLSMADSGPSGSTVSWKATTAGTEAKHEVAPVTFSGGQSIQFIADSVTGLWVANVSRLPAKAVAYGRQLWVNDRRAPRSTEPGSYACEKTSTSPCSKSKTLWGDKAWEMTNETIRIVDAQAAARAKRWPNSGAGVEFVWTGVQSPGVDAAWAESRCQVKQVMDAGNGSVEIKMSQPCLSCFVKFWGTRLGHVAPAPTAIEAIGKQQLAPGEWWLDRVGKAVWYKPLSDERLSTTRAIMPVLEHLLVGHGSGSSKLTGISFSGISFQHATWYAEEGFVENQSGDAACFGFVGHLKTRMVANIVMANAKGIRFEHCEFAHLGANAIDFANGAHNNIIEGSLFRDISAAAVQIGRTDGVTQKLNESAMQDIGNTVSNSIIVNPAVEYHGSVGISVGYTIGTNLSHNDIGNCTYGPISVGWGWGAVSYAANNTIIGNNAHDYKTMLNDGGCIYTLSPQPGNLIAENWCHSQGTPTSGALYPDEGSAFMTWRDNVVSNIGASEWAHIWNASCHGPTHAINNLVFEGNYHDTPVILNDGVNMTMRRNELVNGSNFPPKAQAIMAAAGPRDSPWMAL